MFKSQAQSASLSTERRGHRVTCHKAGCFILNESSAWKGPHHSGLRSDGRARNESERLNTFRLHTAVYLDEMSLSGIPVCIITKSSVLHTMVSPGPRTKLTTAISDLQLAKTPGTLQHADVSIDAHKDPSDGRCFACLSAWDWIRSCSTDGDGYPLLEQMHPCPFVGINA